MKENLEANVESRCLFIKYIISRDGFVIGAENFLKIKLIFRMIRFS